jgi:putative ubiquitin-RnfH superfamily antitoxin RatB of RatAB toxin-antitoxin module
MTRAALRIEVAYASAGRQALRTLTLPEGASVADAVRASGLIEEFPEIDLGVNRVGIYGRQVRLDAPLRDRDRVEILRPLRADPKEQRRARAGAQRKAR